MERRKPVIYLLYGEDEYGIARFVAEMTGMMGDAAIASLNITRLDGRSLALADLAAAASAMPFLVGRRVVIVTNPLAMARLENADYRKSFLDFLGRVPASTALVLIEYRKLTEEKERKKGKLHWLEKWADEAGERVHKRYFGQPRGAAMERWILARAKERGGSFVPNAAGLLASLLGEDTRLADQEIQKLLMYVNYQRPVEADDVERLTPFAGEADIFAMVDALGSRNSRQAMGLLHRLLAEQDPLYILAMVVRQFRLLLLAREILDGGGGKEEVVRLLGVHPYVADKVTTQAQRFTLQALEDVYRSLLEVDRAIKSGEMAAELSLDLLVARLTT